MYLKTRLKSSKVYLKIFEFNLEILLAALVDVSCTPKCESSRCRKCSNGSRPYTVKEERELHMIEKGLCSQM